MSPWEGPSPDPLSANIVPCMRRCTHECCAFHRGVVRKQSGRVRCPTTTAARGLRADLEWGADAGGALAHDPQAHVLRGIGLAPLGVEAAPVVANGGAQLGTLGYTTTVYAVSADGQEVWAMAPTGAVLHHYAVPEPSTFVLLGMGAVGLLGFARRRRKRTAQPGTQPR